MKRRVAAPHTLAGLLALGLVAAWIASGPGCAVVEKTSDAMADATKGSSVEGIFRGTARLAESSRDYSTSEEHYIGRSVSAQILQRYKVHPDRNLQDYVNLVGKAVLAAPEVRKTFAGYRFIVIEGQELQGVSAPGGYVFISEGAVRRARNEDELAALLAHEIAHVSLRHGIAAIQDATRQKSFALLAQGIGQTAGEVTSGDTRQLVELTSVFGDAIRDITSDLLVKGYSRDLEIEADLNATKYLRSAGYSPGALRSYLSGIGDAGGKGGWTATHPSPSERIQELDDGDAPKGPAPGLDVRNARFRKAMGIR
jgi:predicted Zn-dependent protease